MENVPLPLEVVVNYLSPEDTARYSGASKSLYGQVDSVWNVQFRKMFTDVRKSNPNLSDDDIVNDILHNCIVEKRIPLVKLIISRYTYDISDVTVKKLVQLLTASQYTDEDSYAVIANYIVMNAPIEIVEMFASYKVMYNTGIITNVIFNPNYVDHPYLIGEEDDSVYRTKWVTVILPSDEEIIDLLRGATSQFALLLRVTADDPNVDMNDQEVIRIMFRLGKYDSLKRFQDDTRTWYDPDCCQDDLERSNLDAQLFLKMVTLFVGRYKPSSNLNVINIDYYLALGLKPLSIKDYSRITQLSQVRKFLHMYSPGNIRKILSITPSIEIAEYISEQMNYSSNIVIGAGSATIWTRKHPEQPPRIVSEINHDALKIIVDFYPDVDVQEPPKRLWHHPVDTDIVQTLIDRGHPKYKKWLVSLPMTLLRFLENDDNVWNFIIFINNNKHHFDDNGIRKLYDIFEKYPIGIDLFE